MAIQYVNLSDTFDDWRRKYNNVATWQGVLEDLNTSVTSNLVSAINSLVADMNAIDLKASCRIATVANLVATNDTSAKTLTNSSGQVRLKIDGIELATDERVLVKDQTAGKENGIYTVTNIGSDSSNWVLTRATDFDSDAEVTAGAFMFITEGTVNADEGFLLTTDDVITVDTTSLTFASFSGGAIFDMGDVLVDDVTVEVDATNNWLQVKDDGIDKTKIHSDVAGDGLGQASDGSLKVNAGTGITVTGDNVTIDVGSLAGDGLVANSGALDVNVAGSEGLTITSDVVEIADSGVSSIKLADDIDIRGVFSVHAADPLDQDGGVVAIYAKETTGPARRWIGINTADPFDGVWPKDGQNDNDEVDSNVEAVFDINASVNINGGNSTASPIFRVQGTAERDAQGRDGPQLFNIDSRNNTVNIGRRSPEGSLDDYAKGRSIFNIDGAFQMRKIFPEIVRCHDSWGKLMVAWAKNRPASTHELYLGAEYDTYNDPRSERTDVASRLGHAEDHDDLLYRYKSTTQGGETINITRSTPRAWAKIEMDGATPVLKSSYNIRTIEDEGTGHIKLNFVREMKDTDYVIIGLSHDDSTSGGNEHPQSIYPEAIATTNCEIKLEDVAGTIRDIKHAHVVILGEYGAAAS